LIRTNESLGEGLPKAPATTQGDAQVIKLMGQAAGLAGISLGVVFLLFRGPLQKSFLGKLGAKDAYRLATLIVVLAWSIGIVGIGAWIWAPSPPPKPAASQTITTLGSSSPVVQGVGGNVDLKVGGGGDRPQQ
jgi:hypothetical protein